MLSTRDDFFFIVSLEQPPVLPNARRIEQKVSAS